MPSKERSRFLLKPRDVRQISYRDEKSEEEREQLVVDLEESLPVKNSTSRDDDRKEECDRKKAKDIQKTERKEKKQERDAKTRYACRLCEAEHERPLFQRIAGKEEQDGRESGDGCGDGEKFGKRQMIVGIDEKILRISDGRQHTAQIRRDGHPCEDRDHQSEGMSFFEERNRKRHEDDE